LFVVNLEICAVVILGMSMAETPGIATLDPQNGLHIINTANSIAPIPDCYVMETRVIQNNNS